MLINQWVDFYKKVPEQTLEKIKKEADMELVETTISEHIFNLGKVEGKEELTGKQSRTEEAVMH